MDSIESKVKIQPILPVPYDARLRKESFIPVSGFHSQDRFPLQPLPMDKILGNRHARLLNPVVVFIFSIIKQIPASILFN